jgi:hypothetical protein
MTKWPVEHRVESDISYGVDTTTNAYPIPAFGEIAQGSFSVTILDSGSCNFRNNIWDLVGFTLVQGVGNYLYMTEKEQPCGQTWN